MAMPHIGAVVSRTLGPKNPDVPAFIAIGQTVEGAGEIGTLKAFHTAGFLGSEHGPFLIIDPQDAASAVGRRGSSAPNGSGRGASCSRNSWRRSRCISTAATFNARRSCARSRPPTGC